MENEITTSDLNLPGLQIDFDFAVKYIRSKLGADFLQRGGAWDYDVTEELDTVYTELWGEDQVPEIIFRPLMFVQARVLDGLWSRIFGEETSCSPWASLLGILPVQSSSPDDRTAVHIGVVGYAWNTALKGNSKAALHMLSKREVAAAYGFTRYSAPAAFQRQLLHKNGFIDCGFSRPEKMTDYATECESADDATESESAGNNEQED